ncbi:cytochrome P450 [Streptomyces sp. NPDC001407]|uniref:cytochrome P450 n=1 Tax=Streptomyces sp. NPDC001407 TaxID=3364573 RepID=UPI003680EADF
MKNPSQIPTAAGGLPLLGHLVPLLRDPFGSLTRLPERGDLVRVHLGPVQALVLCDLDLAGHVLRDGRTFDKGGPVFDRGREFGGNGLGICAHSEHRRQRRLLQPAFHPMRLPGYAQVATARVAEVTGSWKDGQILDVLAVMEGLSAQITMDTLFSTTAAPDDLADALDALNTIVRGLSVRLLMPPLLDRLPTRGNRRFHEARARLRRVLHHIITERRAAGTDHGDLLSMLLTARDPDFGPAEERLIDSEIIDQIVNFFAGGSETSGSVLAWALHHLGQHPEIETRLHAEVDSVLDGRPATHADLPRLELTGRVLTETLRLWPPFAIFTRTCTADTRLGRYLVPAGTHIGCSPYLLHRQADLYPDPDRFDPDRWAPGHPHPPRREAFLAFGDGPRKCIGDRFGTNANTLALATIAARWHLQPLPDQRVRPVFSGPMLKPRGLRMRAIARTTTSMGSRVNREQRQ